MFPPNWNYVPCLGIDTLIYKETFKDNLYSSYNQTARSEEWVLGKRQC